MILRFCVTECEEFKQNQTCLKWICATICDFKVIKDLMMTLADIQQNKYYRISKIQTTNNILRERLVALGMCEGAEASLLERSIGKSTIAILSNNTRIALRMSEAQEISVKEIA